MRSRLYGGLCVYMWYIKNNARVAKSVCNSLKGWVLVVLEEYNFAK